MVRADFFSLKKGRHGGERWSVDRR
jgi:hypothetical protein